MSERSNTISRLCSDLNARASYVKAKLGILVPSQIKALRLKSNMPRQEDLAKQADMHQSRISMFETPGAANLTIETLSRLAAAFKVGLIVKFVPYSEMLEWENNFSQDAFDVVRIDRDYDFTRDTERVARRKRKKHMSVVGFVPIGSPYLTRESFPTGTQGSFEFLSPLEKGEKSWPPKSQVPDSPNSRISGRLISTLYTQTISPSKVAYGT